MSDSNVFTLTCIQSLLSNKLYDELVYKTSENNDCRRFYHYYFTAKSTLGIMIRFDGGVEVLGKESYETIDFWSSNWNLESANKLVKV